MINVSIVFFNNNSVLLDDVAKGLTLTTQCIILDNSVSTTIGNNANSYLLYDNLARNQTALTLPDQDTDSAGGLALYDNNTNLTFNCLNPGTVDFYFTIPEAKEVNSMGVAGANLGSSTAVWEFYTWNSDTMAYEKKAEGSGKRDNSPIFNTFDTVTTNRVRFRFITTAPLRVGELGFGNALRFPVPASIGLTPARWSTNNQVNIGRAENNTLSGNTVIKRGSTESVKFDKLEAQWLDDNFIDVLDYEGVPVWFSQDQRYKQNDVIYGNWETSSKPSYESAFRTSLSLKISGAV